MRWDRLKHWVWVKTPNWVNRLRWWVGLKLLYRESKDAHTAMWEIMDCGLPQLTPATIELAVETGHNQTILIKNGPRLIHLSLYARQVIVNFTGKCPKDGSDEEDWHCFGVYDAMFPHNPADMRSYIQAHKEEVR